MKTQMSLEEFTTPAREYEDEMDSSFSEQAPSGKFTKATINELVRVLREAQTLMGFADEEQYPEFSGPITDFPPDFVRGLAMLAKAAEDYGQPGIIDLSVLKDDAGVALLVAKIQSLLEDEGFQAFLASPPEDEMMAADMDEDVGMMEEEDEMDKMFAARA